MGVILEFCLTEMGMLLGGRVIYKESKRKKTGREKKQRERQGQRQNEEIWNGRGSEQRQGQC